MKGFQLRKAAEYETSGNDYPSVILRIWRADEEEEEQTISDCGLQNAD